MIDRPCVGRATTNSVIIISFNQWLIFFWKNLHLDSKTVRVLGTWYFVMMSYQLLPGLTGSFQVLPGLFRSYRVLPGTWSNRVFPGLSIKCEGICEQQALFNSWTKKFDQKVLQKQFLCTFGSCCICLGEKYEIKK